MAEMGGRGEKLTLSSKCNMLSLQHILLCLAITVFGSRTSNPEVWNRFTHSYAAWDRTHDLLEAQVLKRAEEKAHQAIEFRFWYRETEVVERHVLVVGCNCVLEEADSVCNE